MSISVWTLSGLSQFGRTWARALDVPHIVSGPAVTDTVIAIGWHKPERCNAQTGYAGRRIIVWCGNDARLFAKPTTLRPTDVHLVANVELIGYLEKWGIHAELCWFPTALHPKPTPLPSEPHVLMYGGLNADAYGGDVFDVLRDRIDARFTVWGYGEHTDAELEALIDDSTCIVQAGYLHGGLVVREAAEAGRCAISTYELPHIYRMNPGDVDTCERMVRSAIAWDAPDIEASDFWARENSDAALVERVQQYL